MTPRTTDDRATPENPPVVPPIPDDVRDYLERHRDLADLLPTMCARIREAFGHGVELELKLYRDLEDGSTFPALYVRHTPYDATFWERLDGVGEEFNDAMSECSGDLFLTTDFHPPGQKHGV